ncbi:MAG: 4-(cytidine 5'-diphospho)-2-C-methyl-D-erythritol kinase [Clostridioides sp.]|jgi:4-diphosphocytidyl-2-C-methyl-D-erythritol kinase|nr:4-(cytidine 5'-diphospho)-2-C-methyl-D-erythritol kinase [Clostridioides sp.]
MESIKLKSRAKINLSIDVVGKREDNYNLVQMIMQSIDLFDIIELKELVENKIIVKSNSGDIPLDGDNIVFKAASLIKDKYKIDKGMEIFITKNIPIAAGLAGGSSNAAAVLVGLNELWNLNLTETELQELGLKLGADVPFCISGRPALAENIGERLTYINGLPKNTNIVVCKPNIFVSTKEVYENLNMSDVKTRPDTSCLIERLGEGDLVSVCNDMVNVLETVTSKKYPEIKEIEDIMREDAIGTMMSGSGPTVFGIFNNEVDARKCSIKLKEQYNQVFVTTNSDKGVEVIV